LSQIFIFCISNFLLGQSKIKILNSDEIIFDKNFNSNVKKLIGNVICYNNDFKIYCDSAYLYGKENKIESFSNIKILKGDSIFIKCERLIYTGDTKESYLSSSVELIHNDLKVITEKLYFNFEKKLSRSNIHSEILHNSKKIYCNKFVYDINNDLFEFFDQVKTINLNDTILTDTLTYNLKNDMIKLNTFFEIRSESTILKGNFGIIDNIKKNGVFTKKIELLNLKDKYIINSDSCIFNNISNTISFLKNNYMKNYHSENFIEYIADTIININSKSFNGIIGISNIVLNNKDLTAKSDSLSFDINQNIIKLQKNAIAWHNDYQGTANVIEILVINDSLKNITFIDNPFLLSKVANSKYNEISGDSIILIFKQNRIEKINALQNCETVYFIRDKNDSIKNVNLSNSENTFIELYNGKLDNLKLDKTIKSEIIPLNIYSESNEEIWIDKQQIINRIDSTGKLTNY
tara:strand:- start:5726 stop:7114 length:1389 start_codon:yes stop_codon:yes gene_type:complete